MIIGDCLVESLYHIMRLQMQVYPYVAPLLSYISSSKLPGNFCAYFKALPSSCLTEPFRTYILQKLFDLIRKLRDPREKLWSNIQYGNTGYKKKVPTDTEILSNFFFTFISNEATIVTEDKQTIFRNFLLKTNSYISNLFTNIAY